MTTSTPPSHRSDPAADRLKEASYPLLRFEQLGKVYATQQGPYAVLENLSLIHI